METEMINAWLTLAQEPDGGWLGIAVDVKGDELTHDRAVSMHTALGMVVRTLTRIFESVTIVHLQVLHSGEPTRSAVQVIDGAER